MNKSLFFSLILSFILNIGWAEPDSTQQTITISKWMMAGPISLPMPAFANQNNVKGKKFKTVDLLKLNSVEVKHPIEDSLFLVRNNKYIAWKRAKVSKSGYVNLKPLKGKDASEAWLATYLHVDRFIKIKIETETRQCYELYVDGVKKVSKYSVTSEEKSAEKKGTTISIERGTHLILIKTLYNPEKEGIWKLSTHLSFDKKASAESVQTTIKPTFYMDINHLLNGKHLKGASISYNGRLVMLRYNEVFAPNGISESWFEIRERTTNAIVYSSKFANASLVQWVPGKESISFKAKVAGVNKLFLLNLTSMDRTVLLDNLKNAGYYQWSPTGDFIIYNINEKPDKNKNGIIHVVNMMDRWPWWRNRGQLYKLNINDKSIERLTYGYINSNLQDIRKDGKKLLFSQSIPNFSERPYTKQIMMELDLQTLIVDTVWNQNFGGRAQYSPDGNKLVVTGSAAMFEGAGANVPEKVIPNDYDTQAYIFDLNTKIAICVSKYFAPSIQDVEWVTQNNSLIFKVEEKSWDNLYSYNVSTKKWTNLNSAIDMVSSFDVATDSLL